MAPEPIATGCLSTEASLEYALGELSTATRERVEAHVDVCADCRDLVNAAVRGMNAGPFDAGPISLTRFQEGTIVGNRFEISRFIAKGAMGEVYEALDRE